MASLRPVLQSVPRRVLLAGAVLVFIVAARGVIGSGLTADILYLLVVVGASLLAWRGVVACGGGAAGAWIASGVSLSALGDLLWQVRVLSGAPEADVSVADAAYLAGYMAVAIGLGRVRGARGGATFDRFVDTAAVFLVVIYVEWELVFADTLGDGSVRPWVRAVWAAYPVLDAWLLARVARLCFVPGGLRAGSGLLAVGALAWFLTDLGYLTDASSSLVLDAGWALGSLALAGAMWSSAAPAVPVSAGVDGVMAPVSRAQVAVAVFPVVVPGLLALVLSARGAVAEPWSGLAVTIALVTMAFARASRLVGEQGRLRADVELRARRAAALATVAADALIVVDGAGDPVSIDDLTPRSPAWASIELGDPGGRQQLLDRALRCPGDVCTAELRGAGDRDTWIEVRAVDRTADPSVGGIVVILQDVTERRSARDELAHRAFHDELTGLANRALLDDRVEHAVARTARTGTDPVVLALDLDGFKDINDSFGHPAGDELLRQVAQRLRAQVRPGDTVARLGGDEFAVLLDPSPGMPTSAYLDLAARVRDALCWPYEVAGRTMRVGASVGLVVAATDRDRTASALLRDADIALYRAKAAGKGCVVVFDPTMRADTMLRARLAADLHTALADGQFRVAYQPVMDLGTGALDGFEALLRWRHPELGDVSPAVFVPLAEENGTIDSIGRWVLGEACTAAAGWATDSVVGAGLTMAVNLSAEQLRSPNLVDDVSSALINSGLPPRALCLELTETALVQNAAQAAVRLRQLRDLGVRLAVDDFGTGFSSLSHLSQFPVDVLKLDRSFVNEITVGQPGPPVITGLLDLARAMGLDVVAEGVETAAQRDHLRAQGCGLAQGWLFAPALEWDMARHEVEKASRARRDAPVMVAP